MTRFKGALGSVFVPLQSSHALILYFVTWCPSYLSSFSPIQLPLQRIHLGSSPSFIFIILECLSMRGNTWTHHSLMWGMEAILEGSRNKSFSAAVKTKRNGNWGPTELLFCVLFLFFLLILGFTLQPKAVLGFT